MGDAGTRIPEDPFTTVQNGLLSYCKSQCPGYLPSGSHPQTPGELVENVNVCYNCNANMCHYGYNAFTLTRAMVKIRHCGDYFVYYLQHSHVRDNKRTLYSRYCTE